MAPMSAYRPHLLLALILLAGGLLVTAFVAALGTPAASEDRLARAMQDLGGWFSPIADVVRWLTATELVLALGALLALALALNVERRRALVLVVALAVLLVGQVGLKELIDRERPGPPYVEVRGDWTSPSYPSGHTMSGTLFWGYLALSATPRRVHRRWWIAVRAVGAAIVILGPPVNLYLGVHWPTDVIGGLLLGGTIVFGAVAFER
jgi:membrane-associated phospholipid phosphatase